jgi:hypothetical protein
MHDIHDIKSRCSKYIFISSAQFKVGLKLQNLANKLVQEVTCGSKHGKVCQ